MVNKQEQKRQMVSDKIWSIRNKIFSFKIKHQAKNVFPNDVESTVSPFVQSIVSLTSSLMTNSLTVVAKVFSNTLIFLLQNVMQNLLTYFSKSHCYVMLTSR